MQAPMEIVMWVQRASLGARALALARPLPATLLRMKKQILPLLMPKEDVKTIVPSSSPLPVISKMLLASDPISSLPVDVDVKGFVEPCPAADCAPEEPDSPSPSKAMGLPLLPSPAADESALFDPAGAADDSSSAQSGTAAHCELAAKKQAT